MYFFLIASFVLALANPHIQFSAILERRQSQDPAYCSNTCANVNSTCAAIITCECTPPYIKNFTACLNCEADIEGSPTDSQGNIDLLVELCNENGFNIPNITITGGSAPTGSASPSDSVTVSIPITTSEPISVSTSNPTPTTTGSGINSTVGPIFPTASSSGGGNGTSPTSGGSGGGGGVLDIGVSQAFVVTILAGVCLAIASL